MSSLLDGIQKPEDLQKYSVSELNILCDEIRSEIIKVVSKNGGHLASNLGVVELTVALQKVFSSEDDKIVWDVGHQAYTHKILTGRRKALSTIRTQGGLSGYPNPEESPYDPFIAGHSSTSISAALGIATAKSINHEPGHVVAVIGDGALTGGLAYEGLNNAGRFKKNFIVVLNDNKMSISRNVGSISRYLANIRTKPGYLRVKGNVESTLDHVPFIGKPLHHALSKSKNAIKHMIYNRTLFEDMGFLYYGPFDGHDLENLIDVFENASKIEKPILLHVITSKGKGYPFAEKNPGVFHGISKFDVRTGKSAVVGEDFSGAFGSDICNLAMQDSRVCAITAAMQLGTGLTNFAKQFPDRFFDTGIAEEHAVTFAAGLAAGGMLPVFAVYSTFLQRGYDQIIHDAAIQKLNITFAIDRAGVVGEDGETHQGIFDVAFLNAIPNVTVFSPSYYDELYADLNECLYHCDGVTAVRYPRGRQHFRPFDFQSSRQAFDLYGTDRADMLIITYGRLFSYACKAMATLRDQGINVRILKLNRIKPIPEEAVAVASRARQVFFFEEGIQQGGVGEHFDYLLSQNNFYGKYHLRAISGFVKHASMRQSLRQLGLDDEGMVQMVCNHVWNITEYAK